jgi:hypothetical protein
MTDFPDLDEVKDMWMRGFTKPSSRSLQSKIGPSEIAGCPYCVGYTMAAKLTDMPPREADPFGYAAHIGTMCHYYLEHKLDLVYGAGYDIETYREEKLEAIFEIPGYGSVGGSSDLFVPDWGRTFDYKFPGPYMYEQVKLALAKGRLAEQRGEQPDKTMMPSMQYRGQQQIYRKGWEQRGFKVCSSVIIFLPRHTNSVKDVLFWEEPANEELFSKAVDRTELIWDYVQAGQLGELPSDTDCYTCTSYDGPGRGDITNYTQTLSIKEHAA